MIFREYFPNRTVESSMEISDADSARYSSPFTETVHLPSRARRIFRSSKRRYGARGWKPGLSAKLSSDTPEARVMGQIRRVRSATGREFPRKYRRTRSTRHAARDSRRSFWGFRRSYLETRALLWQAEP